MSPEDIDYYYSQGFSLYESEDDDFIMGCLVSPAGYIIDGTWFVILDKRTVI